MSLSPTHVRAMVVDVMVMDVVEEEVMAEAAVTVVDMVAEAMPHVP